MYALVENGAISRYPYTVTDLKRANRDTSFPAQVSDETLLDFGVHKVFSVPSPVVTDTQVLEEITPVFDQATQRWTQVFVVRDLTVAELASRNDVHAAQVRAERNTKLFESDWTQLADSTANKASWATYRQALRDITAQAGFPWTIDWPEAP